MATSKEFIDYVLECLKHCGEVSSKRMFGEYGIYLNGKFIGMVCDNQLFLKDSDAGRSQMSEVVLVPPYEGAKPYLLVEQLENRDDIASLLHATYEAVPMQKPRKARKTTKPQRSEN